MVFSLVVCHSKTGDSVTGKGGDTYEYTVAAFGV
ncbi:hypothetical protein ACVWY4_000230 [Bacillus mycoides]